MRTRLLELARNPVFIPHVYDYCDMWCPYCPVTRRCLVYQYEQLRGTENGRSGNGMIEGIAFARAVAEATRTPIAELDACLADPSLAPRAPAIGDPLELLARHYALQAAVFLDSRHPHATVDHPGRQPAPLAVVSWFHILIAAKTYRALVSADRAVNGTPALYDDARGSAKLVLIGIERSRTALQEIASDDGDGRAAALIGILATLRAAVEQRFPDARSYARPGLDMAVGGEVAC